MNPRRSLGGTLGAAVASLLLTSACAPLASRPQALVGGAPVELAATPFHPQREHQCGPAALATLLGAHGRDVAPDELTPRLFIPGRQGSLQPEMLAQARQRGFIAQRIEPTLTALVAELRAGRPVLVLENLGLGWYPVWHYAVVIGYDPSQDQLVLRSGVTERRLADRRLFERTWGRSDRWGFVLLAPGQLPVEGDGREYARAVASFEDTTAWPGEARRAWEAGRTRWPDRWELAFGLGNRRYADGAVDEAAAAFAAAASLAPEQPAPWNNLAVALMDQGRWAEALDAATRAASNGPSPEVEATLREARCRREPGCR